MRDREIGTPAGARCGQMYTHPVRQRMGQPKSPNVCGGLRDPFRDRKVFNVRDVNLAEGEELKTNLLWLRH
jgi:hypothetical protein